MILNPARAIKPTDGPRYVRALVALQGRKVSGVYGILSGSGKWLYVGESHTGRLYDTITRHFRSWKRNPKTDSLGRRRGGTEYDRHQVRIVWIETAPDEAEALQYAVMNLYKPTDNEQHGHTAHADIPAVSKTPIRFEIVQADDPAPF